ncbi:hypothetical protein T10_10189 [Trichinella papuae]|uniref:Uncharacterized protein n=1 Tax=Trichinella papuae TaxID=268474 RepID=A0A0V1N2U3_9BILA|nr:hypothetical protein T10_10189 [Trichinella papuae]
MAQEDAFIQAAGRQRKTRKDKSNKRCALLYSDVVVNKSCVPDSEYDERSGRTAERDRRTARERCHP